MSWPKGTILVCIDDDWKDQDGNVAPPGHSPAEGEYVTVKECFRDADLPSGIAVDLVEYQKTGDVYCSSGFRRAESDHCEAERARAMKPVELNK